MKKYAIVRFIDEESTSLSVLVSRYLAHSKTVLAKQTMTCSVGPSIDTFVRFVGNPKLGDITPAMINDFIASLSKMKANTVRHKLIVLSSMFKYGVGENLISENPVKYVSIPRHVFAGRNLSDKQLSEYLEMLPLRVREACLFSLYTGLRRGEILTLLWSDVYDKHIVIRREVAKSGKARVVPLNNMALKIMGTRLRGRVFKLSPTQINFSMCRAWKKYGIGRIRFHDMRHISATKYFEATKDLYAMMDTFGWASISSTLPYQHVDPRRLTQNMERLRYKF